MSATLEPIDVFREVTGLNHLSGLEDDVSRPVIERSYELPFPPKNRASWLIDAPAFTVRNRGRPDSNRHSDVREEYLHILRKVADSPGNVMICLPSYREASWAGEQLRSLIDKPVIVDRSSSTEVTNSLKEEFFGGKGKVLVTSTRGTLTEGVDYDGSKLTTCAVIGVPLVNIGSPRIRAVIQAYERKFGEGTGFEYALSIPAVRRSRQAIGRVIRGPDERGVRILVGNRYTDSAPYGSVHQYLSAAEREEFVHMIPMFLSEKIQQFWF